MGPNTPLYPTELYWDIRKKTCRYNLWSSSFPSILLNANAWESSSAWEVHLCICVHGVLLLRTIFICVNTVWLRVRYG